MIKTHLSRRLHALLNFIPENSTIADIGSDHAHLPCRAIQEGLARKAIAGEVHIGPFKQAQANVKEYGMTDMISVRLGDGLDVLSPKEVDTVVIAGMGGELITEILDRGERKMGADTTLILQPNIREPLLRGWLSEHGWKITGEAIVEESPHFYEIIQAKHMAIEQKLTDAEKMMGPFLLRHQTPIFKKKWTNRAAKMRRILDALNQSEQTDVVSEKKKDYLRKIQMIESILNK